MPRWEDTGDRQLPAKERGQGGSRRARRRLGRGPPASRPTRRRHVPAKPPRLWSRCGRPNALARGSWEGAPCCGRRSSDPEAGPTHARAARFCKPSFPGTPTPHAAPTGSCVLGGYFATAAEQLRKREARGGRTRTPAFRGRTARSADAGGRAAQTAGRQQALPSSCQAARPFWETEAPWVPHEETQDPWLQLSALPEPLRGPACTFPSDHFAGTPPPPSSNPPLHPPFPPWSTCQGPPPRGDARPEKVPLWRVPGGRLRLAFQATSEA